MRAWGAVLFGSAVGMMEYWNTGVLGNDLFAVSDTRCWMLVVVPVLLERRFRLGCWILDAGSAGAVVMTAVSDAGYWKYCFRL